MNSKNYLSVALVVLLLLSTIGSLILLGDRNKLCNSRGEIALQKGDEEDPE